MSGADPSLTKLAQAVATRHQANLARLAQINVQIGRVNTAIAELRKPPQVTQDAELQALGEHQAWAWRKEQHLLKVRQAMEAKAAKLRALAARSHGEERATKQLLKDDRSAKALARDRRLERETPLPPARRPG